MPAHGNATRGMMSQKLGGHADEMEASLILAIAPDLAHIDRAVEDFAGRERRFGLTSAQVAPAPPLLHDRTDA